LHGYRCSGDILFNNAKPSDNVIRSLTSYVQDDAALLPSLTVRETLHFAALLRLPITISNERKIARAEHVLTQLRLDHCANTLVGSKFVNGISGGERRRVSIAVQILTNPKILVLDEPTSGLDGKTAYRIMELLQTLAQDGVTVICTIHQSRSDFLPMFGNLTLLATGGRIIYSGMAEEMIRYFHDIDYQCPAFANPAYFEFRFPSDVSDFALDLCSVNSQQGDHEAKSRERVEILVEKFRNGRQTQRPENVTSTTYPAQLRSFQREALPFVPAYVTLLKRSYLNYKRRPNIAITKIMQVSNSGIILAFFYSRLGNDYAAIQNRVGYIQQLTPLVFIGMLVCPI
jgi:ABC-type multidrug transport system ATPase subunit